MSEQKVEKHTPKTEDESKTRYTYAIMTETNDDECETWYTFIRYEGNEKELQHIDSEFAKIKEWQLMEGFSIFEIDIENRVSEETAREMTHVDVNHYSMHRKFDGVLQHIDFKLDKAKGDRKKIRKISEKLAYFGITDFIDKEDVDPALLVYSSEENSDSKSDDSDESSESSESESSEKEEKDKKRRGKVPDVILKKTKNDKAHELPRFAKAKAHRK